MMGTEAKACNQEVRFKLGDHGSVTVACDEIEGSHTHHYAIVGAELINENDKEVGKGTVTFSWRDAS